MLPPCEPHVAPCNRRLARARARVRRLQVLQTMSTHVLRRADTAAVGSLLTMLTVPCTRVYYSKSCAIPCSPLPLRPPRIRYFASHTRFFVILRFFADDDFLITLFYILRNIYTDNVKSLLCSVFINCRHFLFKVSLY